MRIAPLFAVLPLALAADLSARDDKIMMSYEKAMNTPAYKEKLGHTKVRFSFGMGKGPTGDTLVSAVANRKTNAFNKTDEEACEWVFLSCMMALNARAEKEGADAVVDIVSYYKKSVNANDTAFECHAGTAVAGVALKGTMVKTGK